MRRLIAALLLATLGLALVGQYRMDPGGVVADPWQAIYQGLQLFGFNGDWTTAHGPPNVEVQLARFLAPLLGIMSLVLVFVRGAWVGIVNVFARFRRDHVVLIGLNALGWHFARSCRRVGLKAVAVERDFS